MVNVHMSFVLRNVIDNVCVVVVIPDVVAKFILILIVAPVATVVIKVVV